MVDGIVKVDSEFGKSIGFTAERFVADSYLWRDGNRIVIYIIIANPPGKGSFRALVKNIENAGFKVAVPTPYKNMKRILIKQGFEPCDEHDEATGGTVEMWMRPVARAGEGE